MVQNRCKSAQTTTKYWSIISEIWPENQLVYTKSNCIGFRITSSVAMIIGVTNGLQEACNWRGWGWVKMFSEFTN